MQESSRVNKCLCNFARLITIKVGVFKNAAYVTYPRFHSSSRYSRDSHRCLHDEEFSLYLWLSDLFRTKVTKVVVQNV